ncbi:threonyl-tRNA synthetase [Candidatus Mancarchaeum acidiphilum]|uniref:Threonyl-tRNA synthetase n=1 Tax=Candidatus Mancarchaeum acidiphilum TaxID=1920749 RepID=A0A218NP59_9ARCH|nr:threonyl-tRNA synthetase editing domain-containing protein [Candidatus Mancarchaeum acidiphilum]ASI14251.1 threonyl-tRNA synthetase [Candidatus Mancarchaeum acidiphilum]
MKFMMWHVDYFKATPADQGRSTLVGDSSSLDVKNALLFFISFEKSDNDDYVNIIDKAVNEIQSISSQLGVYTLVLNPYAHMFADLTDPGHAIKMLDLLEERLSQRNFKVYKMAFGRFYEIELKAKGHKLSRISRSIN